MIPLYLQKYNNFQFYFTTFIIIICLYFTYSFLFDLFQIHIYRHDAAYYTNIEDYFNKLKQEGRWVNYLFFSIYSLVPGKLAVFLNLLFFFLFVFIVSYRWTKILSYSFLVALLFLQIPPLTAQIMWPATILPAYFTLFLAVLISPYISIYLFYPLFGIIFFGTMSNLYYLLPLVHLSLLNNESMKQNIKVIFIIIIPLWAFGFIFGYLIALSMLYVLSGQFGLKIASWRQTNHIKNIHDLIENILTSFNFLQLHVSEVFVSAWQKVAMAAALLIGVIGTRKERYIPMVILSLAIIVVHYIVTIPIGLGISFRTITATYVGIIVLFFLYPDIKKWQFYLLLPIIMFMNFSYYKINHNSLKWYASITNVYYKELIKVTPLPPQLYKGVAFLSSTEKIKKVNSILQRKLRLRQNTMERLDDDYRWKPIGFEVGFKRVLLCSKREQHHPICKKISKNIRSGILIEPSTSGLYKILGQQDGFLIVSLNDDIGF